jgi:Arc/MetJ-type ribon-helix-helix transcriptional regulator
MVSVRLPRELYDRLERYATQYRQSISELVKDGVELRLELDADPRHRAASSTTEETEIQIDGASVLRDVQATVARHETQMQALIKALEGSTGLATSPEGSAPAAAAVSLTPKVKADKKAVMARLQQMHATGLDSTQIAAALTAEGMPTLKGTGQWHSGTVRKLLNAASKALHT